MTSFSRITRSGMLVMAEGQKPRSIAGRTLEERLRGVVVGLRQQLDGIRDEAWENMTARQQAAAKVVAFHHKRLDNLEVEMQRLEEAWHAAESKVVNITDQLERRITPIRMRLLERQAEGLAKVSTEQMTKMLRDAVAQRDEDLILAARLAGRAGAKEALECFAVGEAPAREARDLASDFLALRQAHDSLRWGLKEMAVDPASHLDARAHATPEERLSVLHAGLGALVEIQDKLAAKRREEAQVQQQQEEAKPTEAQQTLQAALPETETKASA